jgi:hypothetical protein
VLLRPTGRICDQAKQCRTTSHACEPQRVNHNCWPDLEVYTYGIRLRDHRRSTELELVENVGMHLGRCGSCTPPLARGNPHTHAASYRDTTGREKVWFAACLISQCCVFTVPEQYEESGLQPTHSHSCDAHAFIPVCCLLSAPEVRSIQAVKSRRSDRRLRLRA